ncbi:MAG: hypothetical protein QNJ49_15975 [Mastigocoleus sp. MO_167.B18]|nr:hypothetical protein [Mastigocoleus sp. MO_167.B18]
MENNYPIGYETLLADFKRYQKQTPKGISMSRKNGNIYLKFKVGNKPRNEYGCNCSFTLDGMGSALSKAHKVSEALKTFTSESEFREWYDREIKEVGKVENDLLTFKEAIAVVEDDFWKRKDRRDNKRIKGHPSHEASWDRTYNEYYKHLPLEKVINLKNILTTLNRWRQGTKSYKDAMSAYRALASKNGYGSIYKELKKIDSKQTEFKELQTITLEEFMEWRDRVLGITMELHKNSNLDVRKAWMWVFGIQIVYSLRIAEVFAINNLEKPAYDDKGKLIVHAYNNTAKNPHRLIYLGKETNIGTTIKTGERLARPMIPPKYPNLYFDWELEKPRLPENKPKEDSNSKTIRGFFCSQARKYLLDWKAPFTQTHADRHLGNLLGVQAGIPVEIRAQSMGHSVTMNQTTYKKRQGIQTQIDVLTQSNKQAIDFTSGLLEAKQIIKKYPNSFVPVVELISKIYQKSEHEIEDLLS